MRTRFSLSKLSALAAVALFGAVAFAALGSAEATAATAPAPHRVGSITSAEQSRTGSVTVVGWAYNTSLPSGSSRVCVWAKSRCVRTVLADRTSTALDRAKKITGRHDFRVTLPKSTVGSVVVLHVGNSAHATLDTAKVSTPGARIVAIARKYVGKARYVDDGASPKGFDCSGYTLYAYAHAHVATLKHNAEAQRHGPGMHRISKRSARPGDLVFYLSGGSAYHVAIYAGHGKQYAAATPKDGIRYQAVWSSAVEYRTDWH